MISFENVDKFSWKYDLLIKWLNLLHNRVYYRNFYVLNRENVPKKGTPVIVIANHQNGLMDALAILHTMVRDGRQPVFIARGDIFKKERVAKILRSMKIMPTFRTRDGSVNDIRSNVAIFNRAAKVLRKGGTIVIFPEAGHQHGHYMGTFKKGFPRIAFAAEELNDFRLGVQILPLNIHYSNYFSFRSDLMVTVGKPFTFEELFDMYREKPNDAYLALNARAREKVKSLTPDIDVPEYYNEIEGLTQMMSRPYLRHKGLKPNYLPNQKDAAMTIIANLKLLMANSPEEFGRLMTAMREYMDLLRKSSLHNWVINRKLSVFRFAVRVLWMALCFPVFLFGWVNNLIPILLTRNVKGRVKDPMLYSTFQYVVGGIVGFPIYYLLLFAVVSLIAKNALFGLAYMLLTFGCIFFLQFYRREFRKLHTSFRALRLRKTDVYRRLCGLEQTIYGKMKDILY